MGECVFSLSGAHRRKLRAFGRLHIRLKKRRVPCDTPWGVSHRRSTLSSARQLRADRSRARQLFARAQVRGAGPV